MRKRLIGICVIGILSCSIYGCAQTGKDAPVAEPETVEAENTETENEETVDTYIDGDAFLALKEIYGQIDFSVVFYQGDQSKDDLYKAQFNRFLKGEIPILEKETGEEVYIYNYQIFETDVELDRFDLNRYTYYYFDMDGDDNPELCIQVDGNSYFVIKYDEESNQIIAWLEMIRTPLIILGTKKLGYCGSNMKALFVLNDDGEWEYGVWFKTEYNENGFWYMVSLPRYYTQNGRVFNLDDKIKKQGIFDADQHLYYFLVTEEQYNELSEEYNNAVKTSVEAVKEVCYAYGELFF